LVSAQSNTTHDDDGNDKGSTHLEDGGNTEDTGYSDQYNDHGEQHARFDGSSWTNTSSSNGDDSGKQNEDVSLASGSNTESYGSSSNYKDHQESSTDATGATTSSYTHDDGGKDYQDISVTDGGDTAVEHYSDNYKNHDEGGTNPDGTDYGSYTSSGGGGGNATVTIVFGLDSFTVEGHDHYSFTASGGRNSDGTGYGSYTSDDGGGDSTTLHYDDGSGDTLDDTESETYNSHDDNGIVTVTDTDMWNLSGTVGDGGGYGAGTADAGAPAMRANSGATPLDSSGQDPNSGFFGSLWSSWRSIGDGMVAAGASTINMVYDTGYHPDYEEIYSRGPLGQTNTPNTPGWAYYGTRGAVTVATAAASLAAVAGIAEFAGAPQFTALVVEGNPFHVIYQVGNGSKWIHAAGAQLGRLKVTSVATDTVIDMAKTQMIKFTGPVLFGGAAGATGQRALTCISGAAHAFLKGWFPFIP